MGHRPTRAVAVTMDPECCHVEIGLLTSGIAGFDTTDYEHR